ncbi:hypothetical protein QJS10_CPB21g01808 [Acorus calamus]|uniref:Reverse transcriptase domain-containing protein n=1 Tax=Acorus calamus TaxID=4465 RepID=A0AAV9C2X8_ACOCL|nr:hypothetical protein QJS10_CPB21g01808 [Acorus calamus]
MCRLDRVLINAQFQNDFPHSLVNYLAPGISDHSPLLVTYDPLVPSGPKPFKYFEMWESHPTFKETIEAAWETQSRSVVNSISRIRTPDGSVLTTPDQIKDHIVQFYNSLLNRDSGAPIPFIEAHSLLSVEDNMHLLSPVTEEEIHKALFSLKPLSSPGPDSFPARFFQLFWNTVHQDLVEAIQSFFISRRILKQVSHSFIALIPKSLNADSIDQYRPISLCNTLYKIITKVMALRLGPLLPHLVSEHQAAFIKGRSIHHNILLAHELVKYLSQPGVSRACIKVDLRKAFDSIRWAFLEQVLKGCNLNDHWVNLCMECITSARYSVLINGSLA